MNTSPSPAPPERADRRAWLGLGVLALPTLLLSLDMSVLYLALPHLAADLRPTGAQTLWIMDVYGFMIAGFLITMGTLGDRIGRRRLLMIGAAAFGLASVAAAFSTSAAMLIATRTLMGVAGATLMPSTLALISNMFRHPAQRAVAIAVWTSCFMGGTAIGPVVGGLLLQWFWWGSVFLLGVPVMLLLLVCAPLLLPEHRDPNPGRLDLFSVALSLAAILPVIFGLKSAADGGSTTMALTTVLIGVAMGVWFVRRQLRLTHPLLDLRLFRERSFGAALGTMMVGAVAMGGTFLLLSQYLQMVADNSPLRAGLWLVPPALAMIVSTMAAPALAQRLGRANVIGGGMFVSATGFLALVFAPSTAAPASWSWGCSSPPSGSAPARPSSPTSSWAPRPGRRRGPPRPCRRPAGSSVSRSGWPCSAASPRPSTATASRSRRAPTRPPGRPWPAPSTPPAHCPPTRPKHCSPPPARRSPWGSTSQAAWASSSWWSSVPWPWSCCAKHPTMSPPRPRSRYG